MKIRPLQRPSEAPGGPGGGAESLARPGPGRSLLLWRTLLVLAFPFLCLAPVWGIADLYEDSIRITSNPSNNRVDIALSEDVDVRVFDQVKNHGRFYIDIYSTQAKFPNKLFQRRDGILKAIQTISYPEQQVVRFVFYPINKTVFRVADPESKYVFVANKAVDSPRTSHLVVDTAKFAGYGFPRLSAQPLALTKPIVILDPGHGGSDPGALSRKRFRGRRLVEKHLVLSIAKEVAKILGRTGRVQPVLTRKRDRNMSLGDRVAFAERMGGNLFISIHANATRYHKSATARGVEFYYCSATSNPNAKLLEMAENREQDDRGIPLSAASNERSDMVLRGMAKDALDVQRAWGRRACQYMHRSFVQDAYFRRHNRGIKSAAFRVLINPEIPSLLIEVGFIDNEREAQYLAKKEFQRTIAERIAQGVLLYFDQEEEELNAH